MSDKMICIIAGMHRSGTSMLAGLLHLNGISMGTQFREALPENPKGFFEEEAFRRANDRVLQKSGYAVDRWSPSFTKVSPGDDDLERARHLISRFNRVADSWGWKDPRTCLTLPMWLSALHDLELLNMAKVIVIKRNIWAVSLSLLNRGNVTSLEHGAAIWRMYSDNLDRALDDRVAGPQVLEVHYEQLIQGLGIDRLESFCGRRLDTSFIDPTLNRSGAAAEDRSA